MAGRRHRLYGRLGSAEQRADSVVRRLRARAGLTGEPIVQAYRGYGSPDRVRLTGRVLERRRSRVADAADPWWHNAVAVLRRVASRELPDVPVTLTLAGRETTVLTDADGYWSAEVVGASLAPGWHRAGVTLGPGEADAAVSEVLVLPPDASIALVSDIDDTVIHSGITNLLTAARTLLFRNAATRTPWAGVSELYRSLVVGLAAADPISQPAPVFYLSTSPWNLYDLLVDFLDRTGLPQGPLLLMDWGLSARGLLRGEKNHHKRERLDELVRDFADLRLLLVGDSGERDAEVFRDFARAHPGRVVGIVIRNVTPVIDPHARGIQDALVDLDTLGVPSTLCQDATSAAVFAREHGWLDEAAVSAVRRAQEADLRR